MHALVIHPELSGRTRFRQAARAAELFSSVQMSATLADGMERIRQGFYPVTSVFVSRHFDRETVSQFIRTSREYKPDVAAAFLAIIPHATVSAAEVAALAMEGSDSVLLEPFSTSVLKQTTKLAHAIVRQRSMASQKAGIELLLPRLATGIDTVARAMKLGRRTPRMSSELASLQQSIRRIPTELESFYFKRLVEVFDGATVPAPMEEPARIPVKPHSWRSTVIIRK